MFRGLQMVQFSYSKAKSVTKRAKSWGKPVRKKRWWVWLWICNNLAPKFTFFSSSCRERLIKKKKKVKNKILGHNYTDEVGGGRAISILGGNKAVRFVRGRPEDFSMVDAMEGNGARRRHLIPSVKCFKNWENWDLW